MTPRKNHLPVLSLFFMLILSACSSTPPSEGTEPSTTETSAESTRIYGGGFSLDMPAGWVQDKGNSSVLIYNEESRGLNAFHGEGFSYDGEDLTSDELYTKLKSTSDVFFKQYFESDPSIKVLGEGYELTSFGNTYTLIMEGEMNDGTTIHQLGIEQWVYVDDSRILRFQGTWEKGDTEGENAVVDTLFTVTVD